MQDVQIHDAPNTPHQGRANKPREAVLQLAEMAKLGVQPDTQAATALLDACARNGNMDMAESVFDELFGMCGWGWGWGVWENDMYAHRLALTHR